MFNGRTAEVAGIGAYVPERVLTNADLEKIVDTNDEWITTRTGIKERHIAPDGVATSAMMAKASEIAIKQAGIELSDIQMVIGCTATPDMAFPSVACLVQQKLGMKNVPGFDIEAGCSGFVYGLSIASQFIASGAVDTILVLGGDTLSRIQNWTDRSTCVLFGDSAGAVVLRPGRPGHGIINFKIVADGSFADSLYMPAGGSLMPASEKTVKEILHSVHMDGREVFRQAVTKMPEAALTALGELGLSVADVDHYIPHQANIRIIDAAAKKLGIPHEKVIINVDRYGNTSCGSLPLALYESVMSGRIKDGDLVLLTAVGSGLTWGALLLRWGHEK